MDRHEVGSLPLGIALWIDNAELMQPEVFHHTRDRTNIEGTCRFYQYDANKLAKLGHDFNGLQATLSTLNQGIRSRDETQEAELKRQH
jgi:hypothetical protein